MVVIVHSHVIINLSPQSQAVGRDLRLDYELRQRELQERSGQLAREYGQQGAAERHRLGLLEAERNRLLQQVGQGQGEEPTAAAGRTGTG